MLSDCAKTKVDIKRVSKNKICLINLVMLIVLDIREKVVYNVPALPKMGQ
jgi:hypothetical protein